MKFKVFHDLESIVKVSCAAHTARRIDVAFAIQKWRHLDQGDQRQTPVNLDELPGPSAAIVRVPSKILSMHGPATSTGLAARTLLQPRTNVQGNNTSEAVQGDLNSTQHRA